MHSQRGQALPIVALSMVATLYLASLAIDVGNWRFQQRLEQTAADSAAIAGAVEYNYSSTSSAITSAAQTDAATNGYTDGSGNVTVKVNNPPKSGNYTTSSNAVEVIVYKLEPDHFDVLHLGSMSQVSARAVAMTSSTNRNCIYALDTDSSAITEDDATITMPNCGMVSNGGLLFNGGTINARSIGYAGSSVTDSTTTFTSATPKQAVAAVDPCMTISGCAYLTSTAPTSGTCASQTTYNVNGAIPLSPGKYCSQVLTEGSGCTVTFAPGTYVFEDGFTNNSCTAMSGTGVTIYNQGGSFIDDTGTINIAAPTTGNYAGVVFYQPSSNTSQFTINGGSSSAGFQGMIYAPTSDIIVDGALSTWVLVVCDDITLNSSSSVNVSSSTFPVGGHAVLVE